MKSILLVLVCFIALSHPAHARNVGDIFTENQRLNIVRAIDNICGDTWCEGDYDFKFHEFKCDQQKESCELSFQFILRDNSDKTGSADVYSEKQVCHFAKINNFSQIMSDEQFLNESFYDELNNCIGEREQQVSL